MWAKKHSILWMQSDCFDRRLKWSAETWRLWRMSTTGTTWRACVRNAWRYSLITSPWEGSWEVRNRWNWYCAAWCDDQRQAWSFGIVDHVPTPCLIDTLATFFLVWQMLASDMIGMFHQTLWFIMNHCGCRPRDNCFSLLSTCRCRSQAEAANSQLRADVAALRKDCDHLRQILKEEKQQREFADSAWKVCQCDLHISSRAASPQLEHLIGTIGLSSWSQSLARRSLVAHQNVVICLAFNLKCKMGCVPRVRSPLRIKNRVWLIVKSGCEVSCCSCEGICWLESKTNMHQLFQRVQLSRLPGEQGVALACFNLCSLHPMEASSIVTISAL